MLVKNTDSRLYSRRAFLAGAGLVAAGVAIDSLLIEPQWLDVSEHDVAISGLPRDLDGFTIAQITDAHLTRLGTVEDSVFRALQRVDVQLIVLSGDMIDSPAWLGALKEFCLGLRRSGRTIVAALGNWEHWGNVPVPELAELYRDLDVELLVNGGLRTSVGLRVFATDDATGGAPRVQRLYDERAQATVMVTHSPAFLDSGSLSQRSFAFALAGHTHGGQMRLGPRGAPFLPPGCGRFLAGWYDTRGGKAYVSRGTGTSIMPARFMCRPELPIFRLRQG